MTLAVDLSAEMPIIMDQGARPTCLPCSISDAHQFLYREVPSLSVECLFHGCVRRDRDALDHGATFEIAKLALADDGQPEGSEWPYEPMQPELQTWLDPNPLAERFKGLIELTEPTFAAVSGHLIDKRPVVLALRVRDSLIRCGPDGKLESDCAGVVRGMHAVLAVGLRTNPSQKIKIRNSWGSQWGALGYAEISENYFDANVVLAALVNEMEVESV